MIYACAFLHQRCAQRLCMVCAQTALNFLHWVFHLNGIESYRLCPTFHSNLELKTQSTSLYQRSWSKNLTLLELIFTLSDLAYTWSMHRVHLTFLHEALSSVISLSLFSPISVPHFSLSLFSLFFSHFSLCVSLAQRQRIPFRDRTMLARSVRDAPENRSQRLGCRSSPKIRRRFFPSLPPLIAHESGRLSYARLFLPRAHRQQGNRKKKARKSWSARRLESPSSSSPSDIAPLSRFAFRRHN